LTIRKPPTKAFLFGPFDLTQLFLASAFALLQTFLFAFLFWRSSSFLKGGG
jgi:hypothetical protein